MKCPLDSKRCYVHDPHVKGTTIRELPLRCRHGEYHELCPAQQKLGVSCFEEKLNVAFNMMKAERLFSEHMNKKVLRAIEKGKKARAIGWELLQNKKFMITAQPPMTLNDAIELIKKHGFTWKQFAPFYKKVEKEEQAKCPECGGTGEVEDLVNYGDYIYEGVKDCPVCKGSGKRKIERKVLA